MPLELIGAGWGRTGTVSLTFWRELTQFYPKAKVLLSVRDPDQWFESTQATIFNAAMAETMRGLPLTDSSTRQSGRASASTSMTARSWSRLFNGTTLKSSARSRRIGCWCTRSHKGGDPCASSSVHPFPTAHFRAQIPVRSSLTGARPRVRRVTMRRPSRSLQNRFKRT